MLELIVGEGPIGRLLDIGTGTGRILELLAPHSERSIGLDVDHDMLVLARAALGEAQLSQASVRHGDLHRPPFEAASFDVAVMHHVLHLLDDPGEAVADAARLLRPGGRLLIADFAAHELEYLREPARSSPSRHRRRGDARTGREPPASRSRASARCRPATPGRAADGAAVAAAGAFACRRPRAGGGGVMASVSFEVFPPRTRGGRAAAVVGARPARAARAELRLGHLRRRRQRRPTRRSTRCARSPRARALRAAGHLTCVGRSRAEIDEAIACYWAAGVRHIVALRGDMPELGAPFAPHPGGYASSIELVDAVRRIAPFEISVAAYPEPHPDSRSLADDLERARAQGRRGRDARDHAVLLRHRRRSCACATASIARGIELPVVPGIMLATNFEARRADGAAVRRERPGLAGRPVRRPRGRRADAQAGRGDRRRRPGRGAAARGVPTSSTSTRSTRATWCRRCAGCSTSGPREQGARAA